MNFSALQWQKEIYLNGFAGGKLIIPTDFDRLERMASRKLSPKAFAYIAGGAGSEKTIQENKSAFSNYKIIPRTLRDVGSRETSVTIFNHKIASPFLLSPIGVLELAHPQADLAVAKAAADLGVPFIFSNQGSIDMETCSAVMHNSPRWFQLYWSKSNELVASFVKRAEQCGCSGIVVTLDTTMLGWRTRDLDLGYLPFLEGKGIAQYTSDPVFLRMLDEPASVTDSKTRVTLNSLRGLINMVNRYPGKGFLRKLQSRKPIQAVQKFISTYSNPCTTWEDLKFLRSLTKLPILLKGILHPDDAIKSIDHGINGIIVSNHGGRQIDGAISSLDALPEIVNVVSGRIPVILDSGVRSGADAFKAIALGATAVCIGRPYAYGLAVDGERGVRRVLQNFMTEFELTMALTGCANIAQITPKYIRKLEN
jgi:lactate 2-monooxygenase